MNVLRIILALIIGWIILMVLFFIGLCRLVIGFMRRLFGASSLATRSSVQEHALDMVRCPNCGVYTSGTCSNPACSRSKAD